MKKYISILFIAAIITSSCSKNKPTIEVDQEELSAASLVFTPVEVVDNNGSISYVAIEGAVASEIEFKGNPLLPNVGAHIDLHVGETYKMELKSFDFAGRASQQTFVERAESHQAFLVDAPVNSVDFVYNDNQVGVTAYITIKKETSPFTWRYAMRHLNNGVKNRIQASDWNNVNFLQFTGANDLDLKFQAHFVTEHEAH